MNQQPDDETLQRVCVCVHMWRGDGEGAPIFVVKVMPKLVRTEGEK